VDLISSSSSSDSDENHDDTTEIKSTQDDVTGTKFNSDYCNVNIQVEASRYVKRNLERVVLRNNADGLHYTERDTKKRKKANSQKCKEIDRFLQLLGADFECPFRCRQAGPCLNALADREKVTKTLDTIAFDSQRKAGTVSACFASITAFVNDLIGQFRYSPAIQAILVGIAQDVSGYSPHLQRRRQIRNNVNQEKISTELVTGSDITDFTNSAEMTETLAYLRDVGAFVSDPTGLPKYAVPNLTYPPGSKTVLMARDVLMAALVTESHQRPGAIARITLQNVRDAGVTQNTDDGSISRCLSVLLHKGVATHGPAQLPVQLGTYCALQNYIEFIRPYMPRFIPEHEGPDKPVFYSTTGAPFDPDYLSKRFSMTWSKCKMPKPLKSVTRYRQSVATAVLQVQPALEEDLCKQMTHSTSVARKHYQNKFLRQQSAVDTVAKVKLALSAHKKPPTLVTLQSYQAPSTLPPAATTFPNAAVSDLGHLKQYCMNCGSSDIFQPPTPRQMLGSPATTTENKSNIAEKSVPPSNDCSDSDEMNIDESASPCPSPKQSPSFDRRQSSTARGPRNDSAVKKLTFSEKAARVLGTGSKTLLDPEDEMLFLDHPEVKKMTREGKPDRKRLAQLLIRDPLLRGVRKRNNLKLQQACDKIYSTARKLNK